MIKSTRIHLEVDRKTRSQERDISCKGSDLEGFQVSVGAPGAAPLCAAGPRGDDHESPARESPAPTAENVVGHEEEDDLVDLGQPDPAQQKGWSPLKTIFLEGRLSRKSGF